MAAERAKRLLVVSHEHPPAPGIGGTRWSSMTRYLRELGFSVTLVASSAWGTLPDDSKNGVMRVPDLRGSKPARFLLGRGKLRVEGDSDLVERPPGALLTKVFVPEISVLAWLPPLTLALRRLLAAQRFDCLITSSPPESAHLAALLLGSRRPAWLADFRDGWCFEPWREPFPTHVQRHLDRWLERRVAQTADVCVGATRPIADDLAERLGASAAWVLNGWNPANAPTAAPPATRTKGGQRLVYTGTLSGEWGRDPEPLFRALAMLGRELGDRAPRLIHAGPLSTRERESIGRYGISDLIEHLGTLARAEALALQRSADALVLLTSANRSEATGKIFEYLAAGRPIIALARGNEAERIVQDTATGITVPPDDVDAIASALRRFATSGLDDLHTPRDIERFFYPGPANEMAALINEAVDRRLHPRSARKGFTLSSGQDS